MLVSLRLLGLGILLAVEGTPSFYSDSSKTNDQPVSIDKRMMVIRKPSLLWTKAIMPYVILDEVKLFRDCPHQVSKQFCQNKHYVQQYLHDRTHEYERVMAAIEDLSCIRFIKWNESTQTVYGLGHPGHVKFYKGNGCHSFTVGLNTSPKGVRVSCCSGKDCLHEIGHALGFFHEQANPKRDGWIRVNEKNIIPNRQSIYAKTKNKNANYSLPYDISSVMHYQDWMFHSQGATFIELFPELKVGYQYYYFFMEMAGGYSCNEKPQCQGKILKCENDGYQTILHGKCACKCPDGLDPHNLCRTPLKKVTTASWPKGQYGLPQPTTGCPSGESFQAGHLSFTGPGGNSLTGSDIKGPVHGKMADLHFCSRTAKDEVFDYSEGAKFNWPLGNYCVYMKGDKCPTGFDAGSIHYNSLTTPVASGELPDGSFDKNMEMKICCQFRGFHHEPNDFPTDKPFALIKHPKEKHCQAVQGMRYSETKMTLHGSHALNIDPMFNPWFKSYHKSLVITICHYRQVDMHCGNTITLSKSKPETTIAMSGVGRTDLECTWVIKGDTSEGSLVFDFEEYNLKKSDGENKDKVEVRNSRIGQWGQEFHSMDGWILKPKQVYTIRSVFDKMLVRFFTHGQSQSSFKAKIRWVPNDEMCYDVEKRGASYDGNVNYTRSYKSCLPWSEMTECPHNPYKEGDVSANLEGNSCRNPDHSFRPWCYTSKTECEREYCDVCELEKLYDNLDFCPQLKDSGFCTIDAARAVKSCAKTCYDLLPKKSPIQKYSDMTCGPPPKSPRDGDLVGMERAQYKVGDTVQYKCKTIPTSVTSTCLTSGLWSDVGSSCLLCPTGQFYYSQACYGIVEANRKFTYSRGVAECLKKGGAMAVPRTKEEAHVIMEAANHSPNVWIRITDAEVEGTFKYSDGTPLVWKNWDTSEPNNKGSHGEDCAVMKQTTKWMDVSCTNHYHIVCALPTFNNPECLDVLGDSCPSLMADRPSLCIDYPDFASQYCRRTCGVCQSTENRCDVRNSNPGVVTLAFGESTIGAGEFINYKCDRFRYRIKGGESRACLPSGELTGEALECGECPVGFKKVKDACQGLLEDKKKMNDDAKKLCKNLGGFLAMPKTKEENDALGSIGMGQTIWLGAAEAANGEGFKWADGTSIGWSNWIEGSPNSDKGKHCTAMDKNKKWINVHCNSYKSFLLVACTIPKTDGDLCYDVKKDGGASYDGNVNYTTGFEPCLPWSEVTQCPHHPFQKGDEMDNLEGNFCRNPDKSYRPWCYTDKDGCKRDYCDVCGTVKPVDKQKYCDRLKAIGFCKNEPAKALELCSATCLGELTNKDPVRKYSDIHCGPPSPPTDAVMEAPAEPQYNVGDTVEYKCKTQPWGVFSRCQTSGLWSETGFACLQKDCHGFNGTCYSLLQNAKHFPYDQAVSLCKGKAATVAAPRSQLEADYISNIVDRKITWVGINDKKTEGSWVYENGGALEWTRWNPTEPNNKGSHGEDCAAMTGSTGWMDVPCTYAYPVVCATRKIDVPCQDFLPTKCPKLLAEKPSMCREHPSYAKLYCAGTCGHCRVS